QSRISKIESSYDDEVSVKDLLEYGYACGLQLELGYRSPTVKIADRIKYHAFKIRKCLDKLVDLGKDDDQIDEGVAELHKDALKTMTELIVESYSKTKASQKKRKTAKKVHIIDPYVPETAFNEEVKV
ncbi:hypothetical protein ACFL3D_05285, partial [Candidatus Omnitrophota bacterium]